MSDAGEHRAILRGNALEAENARLRAALEKIAWTTGGLDTPSTSNAAHYIAVEALNQRHPHTAEQ